MTDGLFRETVRGVPSLPEVNGKYDSVQIGEQIVDSAVYRYVLLAHFYLTHLPFWCIIIPPADVIPSPLRLLTTIYAWAMRVRHIE